MAMRGDREAAARDLAAKVAGLTAQAALATPFLALVSHHEIAEHLVASASAGGISYFTVRGLDALPPVIERLERLDATVASCS
jgi:hypothetical protein